MHAIVISPMHWHVINDLAWYCIMNTIMHVNKTCSSDSPWPYIQQNINCYTHFCVSFTCVPLVLTKLIDGKHFEGLILYYVLPKIIWLWVSCIWSAVPVHLLSVCCIAVSIIILLLWTVYYSHSKTKNSTSCSLAIL